MTPPQFRYVARLWALLCVMWVLIAVGLRVAGVLGWTQPLIGFAFAFCLYHVGFNRGRAYEYERVMNRMVDRLRRRSVVEGTTVDEGDGA